MEPYESKWTGDTGERTFNIGSDRLRELSDVDDFKLPENQKDITGWDVVGADGEKIGEVDDLIVDTEKDKIRFVVVDAVEELTRDGHRRNMLIPIGITHLDKEDDRVVVDKLTKESLESCPPYGGCPITKEFVNKVQAHYINLDPGTANPSPGTDYSDFDKHPLYNPEKFIASHRQRRG
jgi:sporulation protein YlmC with PRC-barrel domain